MANESRNMLINIIIPILVALFFFILSLADTKLIMNPYTVSIGLAFILGMFIYLLWHHLKTLGPN